MNVLVTLSHRFAVTPDGTLLTSNASLGYAFWLRYLDVYDEVHLLVRARPLFTSSNQWNVVSGKSVKPILLPDFHGPWAFAKSYPRFRGIVKKALSDAEAIQLRVPCAIAGEVQRTLPPNRPYGVEVVGDPYDVFAPGSVKHPLRPFLRWWSTWQLQRQCAGAYAATYVTKHVLQRRYPPAPNAFVTHYSSIDLADKDCVCHPRAPRQSNAFTLITVGSLAQLYKAPDVLIDAVAICTQRGLDLRLILVGDGKHRAELEARAAQLGLDGRIQFLGQLPTREAVRAQLDQADLFVLASRTEGLPRAMIEAMARALPCIGSTIGGIPELLPTDDMVPPGNIEALADKIREVITDPIRLAKMSARNLEKAKEYREDVLRERRNSLYRHVREQTEAWLRNKG